MGNKIKGLIALPLVLVIILITIANYIPFKKGLSEIETQMLGFVPVDLTIKEKQKVHITKELKGLWPIKRQDAFILQDLPTPGINYNNKDLSLIVISGKNRLAVIRGVLVKEGDVINGIKIAKIEPNRVLLKSKSSKWIYLEKEK
jgi:hypothetical protein